MLHSPACFQHLKPSSSVVKPLGHSSGGDSIGSNSSCKLSSDDEAFYRGSDANSTVPQATMAIAADTVAHEAHSDTSNLRQSSDASDATNGSYERVFSSLFLSYVIAIATIVLHVLIPGKPLNKSYSG